MQQYYDECILQLERNSWYGCHDHIYILSHPPIWYFPWRRWSPQSDWYAIQVHKLQSESFHRLPWHKWLYRVSLRCIWGFQCGTWAFWREFYFHQKCLSQPCFFGPESPSCIAPINRDAIHWSKEAIVGHIKVHAIKLHWNVVLGLGMWYLTLLSWFLCWLRESSKCH